MRNQERRAECGKLRAEFGEWRVESQERSLESGEWRAESEDRCADLTKTDVHF